MTFEGHDWSRAGQSPCPISLTIRCGRRAGEWDRGQYLWGTVAPDIFHARHGFGRSGRRACRRRRHNSGGSADLHLHDADGCAPARGAVGSAGIKQFEMAVEDHTVQFPHAGVRVIGRLEPEIEFCHPRLLGRRSGFFGSVEVRPVVALLVIRSASVRLLQQWLRVTRPLQKSRVDDSAVRQDTGGDGTAKAVEELAFGMMENPPHVIRNPVPRVSDHMLWPKKIEHPVKR